MQHQEYSRKNAKNMKTIPYLARKLSAALAAFIVIGLAAQASAAPVDQTATVVKVKGGARYTTDNRTWKTLKVGDVLKPGCVVQTAEQSEVDIQLGGKVVPTAPIVQNKATGMEDIPTVYDGILYSSGMGAGGGGFTPTAPAGNMVHLDESSVLAIDKLTSDTTVAESVDDTELDLRAGAVGFNVKKMSAASRYEIKIPNGVAGIRGSSGHLDTIPNAMMKDGRMTLFTSDTQGHLHRKDIQGGWAYNGLTDELRPLNGAESSYLNTLVENFRLECYQGSSGAPSGTPQCYVDQNPHHSPTPGFGTGGNGQGQNGNGQGQNE
jgi:hypothetical protein